MDLFDDHYPDDGPLLWGTVLWEQSPDFKNYSPEYEGVWHSPRLLHGALIPFSLTNSRECAKPE